MSLLSDRIKALVVNRIAEPPPGGVVYYIACPRTQRVKIGFTTGRPEARLSALQTGSPTELRLMAVHPGSIADEQKIHFEFRGARLHGEWFETDEALFEFMVFVCWATAVCARHDGGEIPTWASVGLHAAEQAFGKLPLALEPRTPSHIPGAAN